MIKMTYTTGVRGERGENAFDCTHGWHWIKKTQNSPSASFPNCQYFIALISKLLEK